jgi:hypothetical protein
MHDAVDDPAAAHAAAAVGIERRCRGRGVFLGF